MRRAALLFHIVLLLPAAPGQAQAVLEEVLVTAQKREQRQQDVPLSIVVASGEALRNQALVSAESLSARLPDIHISQSAIGDKLFIRGIGSGINAGFEQSVGNFIDGIYHGRSLQTRNAFLDIERVEVLRGPQSPYFGNSAIAGALNIATTAASREPGGYLSSHYEFRHRERHLEGAANAAVTEQLSLRAAGLRRSLGGWVRNLETGADEGAEDSSVLRLTLAWEPDAAPKASLKLERGEHEVHGRNLEVLGCPPPGGAAGTCLQATAPVLAAFGPEYASPLYPDFDDRLDGRTRYSGPVHPAYTQAVATLGAREAGLPIPLPQERLWRQDHSLLSTANATLTLQWPFADKLTLNAVGGFSAYAADMQQGSDFMPLPVAAVGQAEDFRQWSQELRLVSQGTRLDWMLGWYWQHGDLDIAEDIGFHLPPPYFQPAASWFSDPCRSAAASPGCRLPATIASAASAHAQQDYQQAVFLALSLPLTETLRATLEGRYMQVRKTLERHQQLQDLAPGVTVPCSAAIATLAACSAGLPLLLTAAAPPGGTAFGWRSGSLQLARRDRDFMPAVRLQWEPAPALMLYASYSEGYKAGGFDQRNLVLDAEGGQFGPEQVRATELGLKTRPRRRGLSFDLALFHSHYRDMQVSTFDGIVNFLVNNAASAVSRGAEASLRWQAGEQIGISSSVAWLDARWRNYRNAQCTAQAMADTAGDACRVDPASALLVQDLSGRPLLMAPRYSGNVALDHVLPLGAGLQLHSRLLAYFETAKYLAADNDPATLQPSFAKLDLRVALHSPRGWELALVLRNLTDVRSMAHAEDLPLGSVNSFFALVERPRSITVQGQYRY